MLVTHQPPPHTHTCTPISPPPHTHTRTKLPAASGGSAMLAYWCQVSSTGSRQGKGCDRAVPVLRALIHDNFTEKKPEGRRQGLFGGTWGLRCRAGDLPRCAAPKVQTVDFKRPKSHKQRGAVAFHHLLPTKLAVSSGSSENLGWPHVNQAR